MIPIPFTFRSIAVVTLVLSLFMGYSTWQNSRDKNEYTKTTGRIVYLEETLGELPVRDKGKYRYLELDNYPYVFEIYTDEQSSRMDSLKLDDTVTAYYYETDDTRKTGLSRFLRFLDKNGKPVYTTGNFYMVMGAAVIAICLLLNVMTFILYKKGKMPF
jgi:hypothetical protein